MIAGALTLGLFSAKAEVIYDNSANDLGVRFELGNNLEVGDQILLTSTGYLTNFSFEYFAYDPVNPTDLAVQANVKFYMMFGPAGDQGYPTPGPVPIWESGWFGLPSSERATMNFLAGQDFSPTGLFLPVTEITWSIQFQGINANDLVGIDIYSPPTVGASYPDYWENSGSGWVLKTNTVPMNFAARFEANIPEPSSLSLLVLGGLATFILRRKTS